MHMFTHVLFFALFDPCSAFVAGQVSLRAGASGIPRVARESPRIQEGKRAAVRGWGRLGCGVYWGRKKKDYADIFDDEDDVESKDPWDEDSISKIVGSGEPEDKIASLVRWFRQNGGILHPDVGVEYSEEEGWHLRSKRTIMANEPLVTTPKKFLIRAGHTVENSKNVNIPEIPPHFVRYERWVEALKGISESLWDIRLAVSILREKLRGKYSPIAPYVETLPAHPESLPIWMSGEEIKMLEYPPLQKEIQSRTAAMVDYYRVFIEDNPELKQNLFGNSDIQLEDFAWAVAMSSRVLGCFPEKKSRFDEDEENLDTGYWIVPMCDFATVASDDSNALIERSDGEIGVVSSRIIESGEAITICPGLFSNDFLLTRFGRLSPDNPHESFLIEYYPTLKTDFKTSEPLDSWAWGGGTGAGDEEGGVIEEWRFELLRLMGHGMEKEKLVEIGKGTQIQHLLTACRILSIDEVEKKAVEKAIKYLEKTYEK
ncbi:hypothetical protein AAMO2058_000525400 [Amorphochlora amoebiformis]